MTPKKLFDELKRNIIVRYLVSFWYKI